MIKETVPHLSDSIERPGTRLMVDDHASIIKAMNRSNLKEKGFLAVQCTSVSEVISAISEHNPKTLFLDNSLSSGGNEGLESVPIIRERWPHIKIYCTSNNPSVWHFYEDLGIELVEKDLESIAAKLED